MSGKSFVRGALILSLAGIIGKMLGALYRIPFARIVGEEGVGIYNLAYPLYTLLLALSTAGIPLAVSKMIAERQERGQYGSSQKLFKLALVVLSAIGLCAAVAMFFSAEWIAEHILLEPRAALCLKAIAPAMVFTCLMAVFRGYFQGLQQMIPTAISQIIEQFVRVGTIFVAVFLLMPYGLEVVTGGASFGAATGGFAAFIFLVCAFIWYRKRYGQPTKDLVQQPEQNSQLIKQLLYLAIPISIGSLVLPLMQTIDSVMVSGRLQEAGFTAKQSLVMFGHLSGMAGPIINLPFILTTALAASLVPAIAEAMAANRREDISKNVHSAMLLAIIIVLPAAVGLMALATPICKLLYDVPQAGIALLWAAPTVFVVGLYQTSAGTLQGMGKVMIPMISLILGASVKAVLTYGLTAIPTLGIRGAALATVIGFSVAALFNLYHVSKNIGWQWFSWPYHVFKPAISVIAMAIVVITGYQMLLTMLGSSGLATLLAIAIGAGVYFIVLLAIGGINVEDIRKFPKVGHKLVKILVKLKLARDDHE